MTLINFFFFLRPLSLSLAITKNELIDMRKKNHYNETDIFKLYNNLEILQTPLAQLWHCQDIICFNTHESKLAQAIIVNLPTLLMIYTKYNDLIQTTNSNTIFYKLISRLDLHLLKNHIRTLWNKTELPHIIHYLYKYQRYRFDEAISKTSLLKWISETTLEELIKNEFLIDFDDVNRKYMKFFSRNASRTNRYVIKEGIELIGFAIDNLQRLDAQYIQVIPICNRINVYEVCKKLKYRRALNTRSFMLLHDVETIRTIRIELFELLLFPVDIDVNSKN